MDPVNRDFLWRLATEENCKTAWNLLDAKEQMHIWVAIIYQACSAAAYEPNWTSLAEAIRNNGLEISDETVRKWAQELRTLYGK